MDWFLYDNGLLHERVNGLNIIHLTDNGLILKHNFKILRYAGLFFNILHERVSVMEEWFLVWLLSNILHQSNYYAGRLRLKLRFFCVALQYLYSGKIEQKALGL